MAELADILKSQLKVEYEKSFSPNVPLMSLKIKWGAKNSNDLSCAIQELTEHNIITLKNGTVTITNKGLESMGKLPN
jgi:hypothetical protein